jgi:hypothetical protein
MSGSRSLTPTQRKILRLMREHGPTKFGLPGKYRTFVHTVGSDGFLWIGGYQSPEHFLKARRLIEPCGENAAGAWQLTDFGTELANRMRPPR